MEIKQKKQKNNNLDNKNEFAKPLPPKKMNFLINCFYNFIFK